VPQVSFAQLKRTLRQAGDGGAFFFHGDEELFRDQAVGAVVDAYLDPATRDFNYDQLRGAEVDADALASLLATPPLMASHRVVVIRDAQGLGPRARDVAEAAVKQSPAGLVLVLSCQIPEKSQAKWYGEMKKQAQSVEFAPLSADDAPGWLMETARAEHEVELDEDAARALVGALGCDLGILASELRKLVAYGAGKTRLGLEAVRAVGGALPRQDRWGWFDLVAERRFREALATLPVLLEQGESAVGIVIGLAGVLLRVGLVLAGGPAALEAELKPFQRWSAKKAVPQARKWNLEQLDLALAELLRTDRLLKSASLNDRQALEELLLRLWALRQPRAV
jgi:DNA polymerase-3 subunit delta